MKRYFHLPLLVLAVGFGSTSFSQVASDKYTQRSIDLRAKIINPANKAEFGRLVSFETPYPSLSVAPVSTSVVVGSSTVLSAVVSAATVPNTITWFSSAPGIASVNQSGVVTGISAGSVVITARLADQGITATSAVLVTPSLLVPVRGVILSPLQGILAMGMTTTFTAAVFPSNATNKAVTWISSDPTVARVSATGVVTTVTTAFRGGTTTITVRTEDGNFTASARVIVMGRELPPFIRVTPSSLRVAVGRTAALIATIDPPDAGPEFIFWTSSNPAIATVSLTTGVVTGVAVGSATITARFSSIGFMASSFVTVTSAPPPCLSPVPITLNFAKDGVGDSCYVTTGNISFINSWNMQLIEINGVPFTNRWSNALPPRIDGNYYIHYVGTFPWSHLEINGTD